MSRPQDKSLAKARASRADATPEGFYAARGSVKVPDGLREFFQGQTSVEKGASWLAGVQVQNEIALLHLTIARLTGSPLPSHIVDKDGVTLVMGQWSVTAPTQVEATLKLYREVMFGEDGIVQQRPSKKKNVLDTVPIPGGGYTSNLPVPEKQEDP